MLPAMMYGIVWGLTSLWTIGLLVAAYVVYRS